MSHDLKDFLREIAPDIENCARCELAGMYDSSLRARNMSLTIDNLPTDKLKYVVLAESPPKSKEFFYRLESDGTGWLGSIVFPGFGLGVGDSPLVEERKKILLDDLTSRGVLVIDSCHCACNHLGKRGSAKRKEERMLRKSLVLSCYREYTSHILDKILESAPCVYVLPTFPGGLGWDIVKALKEREFMKMNDTKRAKLLPNWMRKQGLRYRCEQDQINKNEEVS